MSALESFMDIQIKWILTKEWILKMELQEYMQNKYPFLKKWNLSSTLKTKSIFLIYYIMNVMI